MITTRLRQHDRLRCAVASAANQQRLLWRQGARHSSYQRSRVETAQAEWRAAPDDMLRGCSNFLDGGAAFFGSRTTARRTFTLLHIAYCSAVTRDRDCCQLRGGVLQTTRATCRARMKRDVCRYSPTQPLVTTRAVRRQRNGLQPHGGRMVQWKPDVEEEAE